VEKSNHITGVDIIVKKERTANMLELKEDIR